MIDSTIIAFPAGSLSAMQVEEHGYIHLAVDELISDGEPLPPIPKWRVIATEYGTEQTRFHIRRTTEE